MDATKHHINGILVTKISQMKKIVASILTALIAMHLSYGQLSVTTGLTNVQLENLLAGLGVTISNVTINCHSNAYGEFSGTSEIPITHGLMMTTGLIDTVLLGPNNIGSASGDNLFMGDVDLTNDAGVQTYNACVIEFDCVPAGDTLEFNFGFGSEEYPEYVGSSFNDIFAIYFSDTSGSTLNAALVPGTSTPVSTNNVSHLTNTSYYIDNSTGVNIQFDGLTQNLTAFAVVIPGNTYHFKIAIADAGDAIFDSGVLLEAFSFRSTPANFNVEEQIAASFSIFPNPVTNYINIQALSKTVANQILMTDASGRIVRVDNSTSTSTNIDFSEYPAGLYLLTVVTDQGKFTKKIIKY